MKASIIRFLGLEGVLNTVRANTYDVNHFRRGSKFLFGFCLVSTIGIYSKYRENRINYAKEENKISNNTPLVINKFITEYYDGSKVNFLNYFSEFIPGMSNMYIGELALLQGEFDHSREILVYKKLNGKEGYEVYTPMYFYDYDEPLVSSRRQMDSPEGAKHVAKTVKGGLIVNRGW